MKNIPEIIALISFFLGFISVILFSTSNYFISLVTLFFGLFLTFISIHYMINDMKDKKEMINVIPFMTIGLILIIVFIKRLNNLEKEVSQLLNDINAFFSNLITDENLGVIFIAIGASLIIITLVIRFLSSITCRVKVEATVDDVIKYPRKITKNPIYKYIYGGKEYTFKELGRNYKLPQIGDTKEIYIDPDYPETVFLTVSYRRKLLIKIGLILIVIGLVILYI